MNREYRKYLFFGPVVKEYCALGGAFAAARIGSRAVIATGGGERFRGRGVSAAGTPILVVDVPYEWNVILWRKVDCPACTRPQETAQRTIAHLNDKHKWTREAIADWIATLEPTEVGSEAARAVTSDVLQATHALVLSEVAK